MLRAEFSLPSITDEEAGPERKAPIRVKFEIPYFTVSGVQVCHPEHVCFSNLEIKVKLFKKIFKYILYC